MRIGLTQQRHAWPAESARYAFLNFHPWLENGHGTEYRARFGVSASPQLGRRLILIGSYPGSADFLLASAEDQRRAATDQGNTHCAEQQIAHAAGLWQDEALFVDDGAGALCICNIVRCR